MLTGNCRSAVSMTSCVDMNTTGLQRTSSGYIYQTHVVDDDVLNLKREIGFEVIDGMSTAWASLPSFMISNRYSMSSCISVCSTLDWGASGTKADKPMPIDKWFENVAYNQLSYTKSSVLRSYVAPSFCLQIHFPLSFLGWLWAWHPSHMHWQITSIFVHRLTPHETLI